MLICPWTLSRGGGRSGLACLLSSCPQIYLRRRFPTAVLRKTTRRSWCCRFCQRWIREPSISEEVESRKGQGGREQEDVTTKHIQPMCPWGHLPDNIWPISHFLEQLWLPSMEETQNMQCYTERGRVVCYINSYNGNSCSVSPSYEPSVS